MNTKALKKIIALAITVTILATLIVIASGASNFEEAKQLKAFNLFKSTTGLAKRVKKQDAYTIIVKGMGLEKAANKVKATSALKKLNKKAKNDAGKVKKANASATWYLVNKKFLKVNKKSLLPNDQIKGSEASTIIMNILGYKLSSSKSKKATVCLSTEFTKFSTKNNYNYSTLTLTQAKKLDKKKINKGDLAHLLFIGLNTPKKNLNETYIVDVLKIHPITLPTPEISVTPTPTITPTPLTPGKDLNLSVAPKIDYIRFIWGDRMATQFKFTAKSVTNQYPNRPGNYAPEYETSIQRIYADKIHVYVLGQHGDALSKGMTAKEGAIPENYAGTMAGYINFRSKNEQVAEDFTYAIPAYLTQNDFINSAQGEHPAPEMDEKERAKATNSWYIRMNEGGTNRLHQWGMVQSHYVVFHFEAGSILGGNGLYNEEQYVKT